MENTPDAPNVQPTVNTGENSSTNEETVGASGIPSAPGRSRSGGLRLFFDNIRGVFGLDDLGREVMWIAIPAALALAADPLASLVDTAFIGRIGSNELAAVGVSIAIFNQVSKVAIYPLVSVTTSFVAEEVALSSNITEGAAIVDPEMAASTGSDPVGEASDSMKSNFNWPDPVDACAKLSATTRKRKCIPSVSTALIVGAVLGLFLTTFLVATGKFLLHIMGVRSGSAMLSPALRYLTLRSLGAPAVLLSLAMQGVFRGFKDTRTPLYAIVVGDLTNIMLDPILIFAFRMGVSGAAISHVISQYLIVIIMLYGLVLKVDFMPRNLKSLKFSRFLRCGFMLLVRVIAVTFCVTMAASLAARQGPTLMAAFQICLQVWLATSLLADGLAVAGQAIIASAFAKEDLQKVRAATSRILQLSIVLGLLLTVLLGVGLEFGAGIFTKDMNVLKQVHRAIPFVAGTQTINSLAFVFDGVNFGASDYTFSAYSMVVVATVSIPSLLFLSDSNGLIGIWIALTIYMTLRTFASVWRLGSASGPWNFLRR